MSVSYAIENPPLQEFCKEFSSSCNSTTSVARSERLSNSAEPLAGLLPLTATLTTSPVILWIQARMKVPPIQRRANVSSTIATRKAIRVPAPWAMCLLLFSTDAHGTPELRGDAVLFGPGG